MAENYSPRTSGGASSLPPIWKKRLDPAIHVRVYKNGDTNFAGKTITLDRGKTRNFDSWLVELSNNMKLRSGAVWRVFTPTQGHRVDNFDRFEDGSAIVVGGQERFKPISYAQIDPNPKRRGPVSYDPDPLRARRYQVSGKYKKVDIHGKIIKCWANGNETDAPRPVLLPAYRNKPVTLEGVIELVSGMLCNQCGGPVERLYLPDGTRVMSMDQILPNGHYVAARKYDLFKHSNYKEQTLHNFGNHSPTMMRKHMELAPIRSNKTSSHSSPEHSNASHNGHRREKVRKEEEGGIPGRPIKHKRSSDKSRGSDTAREVDYDADRGGVFKAKQENKATKGAKPIDDSRHTRTELPIDKRRAEEVQDEEIKGRKDKKGKKDEAARGPPTQPPAAGQEREEQQRTFRANSKQPGAPTDEQAQQDARARREKEDRERTEKQQKEREALQRKKDDKKTKEQEDKLRKEEEERKKKEAERKSVEEKRKKEETERKKVADEEKRKKEEEEKRKKEGEKKKKEVEDKKRKDQEEEDEHLEEERQKKLEQARKKDATKPQQKNTYDDEDDEDDRSPSAIRREENRRQAEREAEAAIKIQAAARGHLARKRVKLMKEERRAQQEATSGGRDSSLMRDDPIPLASDEDWGPAPTDDYDQQEREQAAIKIQSGFRGYKARQRVKQMRAEREVNDDDDVSDVNPFPNSSSDEFGDEFLGLEAEQAATKLQAGFRGYKTRQEVKQRLYEKERNSVHAPTPSSQNFDEEFSGLEAEQAAVKLQAGFRGYKARQRVKQTLSEKGPSPIHDPSPGFQNFDEEFSGPEAEQAAMKLQAGFRGFKARQEVRHMLSEPSAQHRSSPSPVEDGSPEPAIGQADPEHAAAIKIRATFRGHQQRKELATAPEQEGGNKHT